MISPEEIERRFLNLSYDDQKRMNFARDFLKELKLIIDVDDKLVQTPEEDRRILEYFIFTVLAEYDFNR